MTNELFLNLLPAIFLALASGTVGVFALMRRMSLAADAMSHIALPGLGLALLWKINPLIGGAATLLLGVVLIWGIEGKTKIPTETIIGVIFSLSLALGSLVTPTEDLIDALFGGFGSFDLTSWILTVFLSLAILGFILFLKNKLLLGMVSSDLAKVTGLNGSRLNLYFLLAFAATVILGLKFLGALLMGSLIIIPAAAAKNAAWNVNSMLSLAAVFSLISVVGGFLVSDSYHFAMGPTVIVIASTTFFLSLLFRRA